MKIAITGHTKGIGKAIYEHFQPNIIGFSRSNGYDILKDMESIFRESTDTTVFINNAHNAFAQTALLYRFIKWGYGGRELNNDPKGHIISIGSVASDAIRYRNSPYAIHKQALESANEQLFSLGHNTTLIKLGFVKTQKTLEKAADLDKKPWLKKHRIDKNTPDNALELHDVPRIIDFILDSPHRVKEISCSQ